METSFDCVPYQVQANETCDDLRKLGVTVDNNGVAQPLTLLDLYRYNPSLRCDLLPMSSIDAASLQVRASVSTIAYSMHPCGFTSFFTIVWLNRCA